MLQKPKHKANTSSSSENTKNQPFFQPSLNIGQPGDKYEKEADKVADKITNDSPLKSDSFISPATSPTINAASKPQSNLADTISPAIQKQEEEEEMAQMQPETEKDERVQKQPLEEDDEIQKQEEEEVQAKAESPGVVPADFESKLSQSKGEGTPLQGDVKKPMETSFGTDFSGVRIHTGTNAVQMNRNVGAQAFTHGNDIYFNEGKFNPGSQSGQHLLAHELTHTVQQGATVHPKMIQRVGEEEGTQTEFDLPDGTVIDTQNEEMILPMISLPQFKERNADRFPSNMTLRQGDRPKTQQTQYWKDEMRPSVTEGTNGILNSARTNLGYGSGSDVNFFLKPKNNKSLRVFGNESSLIETFLIPFWDQETDPVTLQVDHIYEDQLGGEDNIYNYELLESGANGSAGPTIAAEIRSRIKHAIDTINADNEQSAAFTSAFPYGTSRSEITRIKNDYEVTFTGREFTKPVSGNPDSYWDVLRFLENQHINLLQVMSSAEIEEEGLSGSSPDKLLIFPGGAGGVPFEIPWGAEQPTNTFVSFASQQIQLFSESRIKLTGVNYRPSGAMAGEGLGFLRVQAFKSDESTLLEVDGNADLDWTLDSIPGLEYGGSINEESVRGSVRNSLRLPGLSPIEILEATIDPVKGLTAHGKVHTTIPVIRDADIDIIIAGDQVRLRKLINTGEFDLPAPFSISDSSLEIFIGTEGLGIEGQINFGIDQVGEGHIGAAASTSGGFELEGAFNFDSELFDPAEINVEYTDNTWTIGGEIGIPENKVRGIKNATITASYSENNFTASGEAELDIPGIERGTLDVNYGEEGFSVGGSFDLSSDIPGIQGGSVEAEVSKTEGEEGYNVSVSGTAQPDIPGLSTELSVAYENGALTIEGSASYERGMLSGRVDVGATNRTINEEGQPTGEPDDTMRVYGGGDLTLQLTPWLEAGAGVRFEPNGELVVSGHIGLPDTVEVFPRKEIRKNLFTVPTVEIPLFAIPLGPRSIGLVAQIGGGLDFSAGFGPGELRELSADVTYNPDREEDTVVHGRGEFAIPADAGLTLRGDLGLGVSVAIASLSGGIELAGTLGLEGEAAAEVDVNWTPQEGITLDAEGRITVNPQFTFDINAFARASLGIGWLSVSETWRHNLASYEWGPGIEFGIVFPVHYAEGEPFDMSFDDIEVIYPDLDVIDMAKDLARDIKDDIF